MARGIKSALLVLAAALAGTVAHAAVESRRPVMPAFIVNVKAASSVDARNLLLIYGENGSDPIQSGRLAADQRIASCVIVGSYCVSEAAASEVELSRTQPQSL